MKVTLVPAQIDVALADKVGVGSAFTVIVIGVDVTLQAGVVPVVAITVTTSPFTSAELAYVVVAEGPCTVEPFTLNV